MRWDKSTRPQDHKSESGDAFVLVWRPSVEAECGGHRGGEKKGRTGGAKEGIRGLTPDACCVRMNGQAPRTGEAKINQYG